MEGQQIKNRKKESKMNEQKEKYEYAGFWIRLGASVTDMALILVVTYPVLFIIYGNGYINPYDTRLFKGFWDFVLTVLFPFAAIVWFWLEHQATPGKIMLKITVVDERTGRKLTLGQSVVRYLGYIVSAIPFFLGYIWAGFDSKKQSWHDKMCGSVVIRKKAKTEDVKFY